MDVYNAAEEYSQMLQSQKRALMKAKERKGQRPRDRKPRAEAYLRFMMALGARQETNEGSLIHSSFIPPAYLPCTTPLGELRRVAIRDLQLETHHRGAYLILRAITPPSRMTAVMVLVEDDREDVIMLQLYQQEKENIRQATDIVNVGSIILIKEPYFKVMASGEYGLRVDHLSDVIYVDKNDSKIPKAWRPQVFAQKCSAETLRMKGNYAMREKKYWDAITAYSDALSQPATADELDMIRRNRSLAFLRTNQFDAALLDTGYPQFGSNITEKALFRASEALYSLQRYSECCEVLELLRTNFSNNEQALLVLGRARKRCSEQTGNYDFQRLQAEVKKQLLPQLDHATYVGPVEIRMTECKGRGLFVTSAVKAGDLLLCEKAFSHAYIPESNGNNREITFLMNTETNKGFVGGQADLIRTIVQKLYCNPSVARTFTTLYHGTYEAATVSTVDEKPVIDTFLVERILSFNVFGCPRSSLTTYKDCLSNKSKEPTAYHSCGIWTMASYINHSCNSNVRRSFIGDMMIVRAARDLESGTELTFWYQNPDFTSLKKLQKRLKNWDFICDCAICKDFETTEAAVVVRRQQLREEMKQMCDSSNGIHTGRFERLLKALNDTYVRPAVEVPRFLLWDPQLLLARIYVEQNDMDRALESVRKVLVALGFVIAGADSSSVRFRIIKWGLVMDLLVEAFLHAQTAFGAIGALEDMASAKEYAKTVYRIVVGEDTSFESTYSSVGV